MLLSCNDRNKCLRYLIQIRRLHRCRLDYTAPEKRGKVKQALSHLHEALTDKDSAQEAYEELQLLGFFLGGSVLLRHPRRRVTARA